jgi:hypothetical protein
MTVQELIDELQKVENKNLRVLVQTIDPMDWMYNNDVEFISLGKELIEEGDDYIEEEVLDIVINGRNI